VFVIIATVLPSPVARALDNPQGFFSSRHALHSRRFDMIRERDDGALELELAPRKLGLILGASLGLFGALGFLAALRGQLSAGSGWGPVIFSAMLAALGAVTFVTARGVRVVLDKQRKLLASQSLSIFGAARAREVSFGEIKELALLGSSTAVGLYAQFGVADDVFIGRFGRTLPERAELGAWVRALKAAIPSATFTAREELEREWLRDAAPAKAIDAGADSGD
jgi:hypothetical protein